MKRIFIVILSIISFFTAPSQNLLLQEIENKQKEAEGPYNITPGECIDLGLSVKWASCNLGATSCEECGDFYSWGETTTKKVYKTGSSKFKNVSKNNLQKKGVIDAYGNLTKEYDAASQRLGGYWRMPTQREMEELVNRCKWYPRSYNGIDGYLIQGPNGNTIFLPNTPVRTNSKHEWVEGGYYRTSTGDYSKYGGNDAYYLSSNPGNYNIMGFNYSNTKSVHAGNESRSVGFCIRPVQK